MLTIQEKILTRFTAALCQLKNISAVSNDLYIEIAAKYLNKTISSQTQFMVQLLEEEFLVQTAIITALMEASETWQQFVELHKKQSVAANNNNPTEQNKDLRNFDKVLKGLLSVPPPKKKNKK